MSTARRLLAVAGGLALGVTALQGSAVASAPSGAVSMTGNVHASIRSANSLADTNDPIIAGYVGPVTGAQTYVARFQIPATGTCTATDAGVAVISLVGTATAASGVEVFSGCQTGTPFVDVYLCSSDPMVGCTVPTGTYAGGDVLTMQITDGTTNVVRLRNETHANGVKQVSGPAINPDTFNLVDNRITFDGVNGAPVQPFGTQTPNGAKINGVALNAVPGITVYDMVDEATGATVCVNTTPTGATSPLFTWKRQGPTYC